MSLSPAYHLRPNKAVERLLFVELLRRLDRRLPKPVSKYTYVGLGGPYLEDFNLIHYSFGNDQMISLEKSSSVLTRQEINRPCSGITLSLGSTRAFTDAHGLKRNPFLVWFDYSGTDWKEQLSESCDLLRKLPSMSIYKVTLPCNTSCLGGQNSKTPTADRAARLSEIFADYGPFTPTDVTKKTICDTLYRIVRRAIADALPDTTRRCVRSLASYRYFDGTPILTITMIVGPILRVEEVTREAGLANWDFADLNWGGPKEIDLPPLSLRERLAIDRLLPKASARTVVGKIKLRLTDDYWEAVKLMDNYVQMYRQVPQFLRVAP